MYRTSTHNHRLHVLDVFDSKSMRYFMVLPRYTEVSPRLRIFMVGHSLQNHVHFSNTTRHLVDFSTWTTPLWAS